MTDIQQTVLTDLLACCRSWDSDVRILGNVRAGDAAAAIESALSMLRAAGEPAGYIHPDNVRRLERGETVAFRKKPYEGERCIPVFVGAAAPMAPDAAAALADCRDAFPVPEKGSELEHLWAAAMGSPRAVPAYIKACVEAQQRGMDAEAWAELHTLRAERGPADGEYATWKDAAIAERKRRVELERQQRGGDPAKGADVALPPIFVGNLPTMNQDQYHGLGDWWVQLRIGPDKDEVLARVYGSSPQQARERAHALAHSQQPKTYRDSADFHSNASTAELAAWQRGWDDCRESDRQQRGSAVEYPQAAEVCAELYQVIGSLADDLGVFDHPQVVKALDNASQHAKVHDDVLPFPSFTRQQRGGDGVIAECWKVLHEAGLDRQHFDGPLPDAIRAALSATKGESK